MPPFTLSTVDDATGRLIIKDHGLAERLQPAPKAEGEFEVAVCGDRELDSDFRHTSIIGEPTARLRSRGRGEAFTASTS